MCFRQLCVDLYVLCQFCVCGVVISVLCPRVVFEWLCVCVVVTCVM